MATKIHPLTGELQPPIGNRSVAPRPAVDAYFVQRSTKRQSAMTFDAARSGTDLDGHWAHADALDSDSANQQARQTLVKRSRYETGSNGYYAGIIRSHCDMLVGTGPNLRMLTGNRAFNQLVEREFYQWARDVQLRRKLWCMAHARTQDGEVFAMLIDNPVSRNPVTLDFIPMETEQCQTPMMTFGLNGGYIDGIKFDEYNNIEHYDILPEHPGSNHLYAMTLDPIKVPPQNMLHWFKLERPGGHRGLPDCKSTLNVGASSRRHREATVAAAETAADYAAISTTTHNAAGDNEPDPILPFTGVPLQKRTHAFNPMGWDITQMKAEHPNATYESFHRLQISEQARPLSMPYNAAACDSSTYSFASGKLDTLIYRTTLDVERMDCDDLVLDRIFAAWFREWTIVANRRDIPPNHQWDWPKHPSIDSEAEERARDTKLKNGTLTMRQAFSDDGMDYEDQLIVSAEDLFGEATDETIAKVRQINVLKNTPQHAIAGVCAVLGIPLTPVPTQPVEQVQ
jgi:capsid protein